MAATWRTDAGRILVLALSLASCSSAQLPEPVDETAVASVRASVHTVCIERAGSDVDLACCRDRVVTFEQVLAARLADAGFKVVDANVTTAFRDRELRKLGGWYDPVTGARDEARYSRLRADVAKAMSAELGCQAVVRPYLGVVRSNWRNGVARWDGVSDQVAGGATLGAHGWASAMSLWLSIHDLASDRELYFRSGGIQLLAGKIKGGSGWTALPESRLLAAPERNRQAVDLALEPLLRKSALEN
ncbi:MAG TPA: hypothetical protein VEL28_13340 [Candidatus Binatia bacterium]|nr:hypothetical protein [Candidatus Binatia bacterium]